MGAVVKTETVGAVVIIRVAPGCAHGAMVTWSPRKAAVLVETARARDGLAAAVVLRPTSRRDFFTVNGVQDGTPIARVQIRITHGAPAS
jgi:hypothetical protein